MAQKGHAVILMMDSFGIGGAEDAAKFGDSGADTLGHIAAAQGGLKVPNLAKLGLLKAAEASTGRTPQAGTQEGAKIDLPSKYGFMREISHGKDTSSGHWEMAGSPVQFEWGYFKPDYPSFPAELIKKICDEAELPGILGNTAASGTVIIDELGEEHIKTGKPICYTSADSVFQIAASEKHFGLDRLYKLCEIAFKHVAPYNIARVIARPFEGEKRGEFKRTKNRHDYSVKPPMTTVLDEIKNAGGEVISVGKISDIFAKQGITRAVKASGLEDIAFITADHGCDPTYKGTDHTREHVPVIMFGPNIKPAFLGGRDTYADIGQTIADYFKLPSLKFGKSFLNDSKKQPRVIIPGAVFLCIKTH